MRTIGFQLGLLFSLLLLFPKTSDATVGLTIASGTTTLLSLTAAQVTGLAALKLLGVTAGALLGRSKSRGKREDNNLVEEESSIIALTSKLEPEQCYQLLFCVLAQNSDEKVDEDVESIHKVVIGKPGKYREAHKFGLSGKECSLRYTCSVKAKEIITFYQSY